MRYLSTRATAPLVGLDAALNAGMAPDGGLYVPEHMTRFEAGAFDRCETLAEVATTLLARFFEGSTLRPQLAQICNTALGIPLHLHPLTPQLQILELWHGPTAAFKDFAARFLAECMARLRTSADPERTVLVATSGDTGAAVAAAFHQRPGFRVVILYPEGRVSPRQAQHLGAFGENVQAYAVAGSFDDCQAMVKAAFADDELRARVSLAAANSISLGRLLPQISYYAWAALQLKRQGHDQTRWIIPTGNLGNALAALLAQHLGLPLGQIVFATNANATLSEFLAGSEYRGRASIATLANAMDVGAPSNAERLRYFWTDAQLRQRLQALLVEDATIRNTIRAVYGQYAYVICPHTACAFAARAALPENPGTDVLVATAHPAKFPEVVEGLVGHSLLAPPSLQAWLDRPSHATPMAADAAALRAVLLG